MGASLETREIIGRFAAEQAQRYLEEAETTYLEKLRRKTGRTKREIGAKLARLRGTSDQAREARDDLILYMGDSMEGLMGKGPSESEAFEKAKEALAAPDGSGPGAGLGGRPRRYYEMLSPADGAAVGLLSGGFATIGVAAGALAGYLLGGGRSSRAGGSTCWWERRLGSCRERGWGSWATPMWRGAKQAGKAGYPQNGTGGTDIDIFYRYRYYNYKRYL